MSDTNQMGGDAVETVLSKDGTAIAFDRYGEGPNLLTNRAKPGCRYAGAK